MPRSSKLWMAASRKETQNNIKSQIITRALEHIPGDINLWKEAISLEDEEGAKNRLYKAVECVPNSVELWLALAKLETYENARVVLNRARKAITTDYTIWVHAAELEEANGSKTSNVEKMIHRAVKNMSDH
jgi:pre-mRNA-processing factor 6